MELDPIQFANQVITRCESTNDLARILGEKDYPHGTWVSTRVQEKGRGRLGREWQSMDGNLFLSLIARISDMKVWTWVPLATAVGAARALRLKYPALKIRIKWPNDLWIFSGGGYAKLGGILCEGVGNRNGSFIVIGIGVNCAVSPEGLDQKTGNLTAALAELDVSKGVSADEIRMDVIQAILQALEELVRDGPASLQAAYEALAALRTGTQITWYERNSEDSRFQAKVIGLGKSGELRVILADGEEKSLFAEDVRIVPSASGEFPA